MISKQDQTHLKKLVHSNHPHGTSPSESTNDSKPPSPKPRDISPKKLSSDLVSPEDLDDSPKICLSEEKEVVFQNYYCCDKTFTCFKLSVDHWFENHHHTTILKTNQLINTRHGTIPKVTFSNTCKNRSDLGNPDYSLFERASYFLHDIKGCPSKLDLFRPCPFVKDPHRIPNPCSAATAAAYDFIQIIYNPTKEYYYFLSRLLQQKDSDLYPGGLSDHLPYWYYWYRYLYPSYPQIENHNDSYQDIQQESSNSLEDNSNEQIDSNFLDSNKNLNKKDVVPTSPRFNLISHNKFITESEKRVFTCTTSSLIKTYNLQSSLNHIMKGSCSKFPSHYSPKLPYFCNFFPCRAAYSTKAGLRYHIKQNHLQPPSSTEKPLIYLDAPTQFSCPLSLDCEITFNAQEQLRKHILKEHLPPKPKKR